MNLAVIPARGGSKRIPGKNIRAFNGRPMIGWAIEAARNTKLFSDIIVSTDDATIAAIARDEGASTPFLRPAELSDDHTPTVPVVSHAVRYYKEHTGPVDYACCIYACSPFIRPEDIVETLRRLEEKSGDFIFPVSEYPHPIQRAMVPAENGVMTFLFPEHELTRTQDLDRTCHDAGQFYWGTAAAWLAQKRMHSGGIGFPIPHWRVVDIDTEDDWHRAEILFGTIQDKQRSAGI